MSHVRLSSTYPPGKTGTVLTEEVSNHQPGGCELNPHGDSPGDGWEVETRSFITNVFNFIKKKQLLAFYDGEYFLGNSQTFAGTRGINEKCQLVKYNISILKAQKP